MAKDSSRKRTDKSRSSAPTGEVDIVCPTVAIGSSAGGLRVLQALFRDIPSDLDVAFVVVAHLEPSHPSELVAILQRCTKMPVHQVENREPLKPNCVYVIAPDRRLEITDSDIASLPFVEPRGLRAPIDNFFRSLAEQHGDGFAIVLSGAGSDGAIGIKAIKEAGGVVIVQDPKEAEYSSMPRSAIATGFADVVASVDKIPAVLTELARNKHRIRAHQGDDDADGALRRIFAFLRARTGHDFSQYKRPTIMRRLTRRMQLNRIDRVEDYARFLRENAEEIRALFSDLLISVTTFFRDAPAFEALAERAIPRLFEDVREGEPIRVWVAGCATGEEAYSLLILILEEAARRDVRPEIQLFATDLDADALATAREGRFPTTIEADVSEDRLHRFFLKEGDHYRVRKEVRGLVLFAAHSLLKDPPFSKLDLVSCRNVLIYLQRDMQAQVMGALRYALKPNGYLFLGSAETADGKLFRAVDREHRIYQAALGSDRNVPMMPRMMGAPRVDVVAPRAHAASPAAHGYTAAHSEALEATAPPSILIDEDGNILHISESAGRYLAPSGGPLSTSLAHLARSELRLDIRAGMHRALEKGETTLSLAVPVKFNGSVHRVFVQVKPAPSAEDGRPRALVLFFEGGAMEPTAGRVEKSADHDLLAQTQEELQVTRDRLRASREEYEAANEELRAANEELQSINEEHRSTAEELETSKEELQSMNEELQTLNAELKVKLEGVSRAHSDLQNLMDATEVGTLFLDTALRIQRYTSPIATLFNVTPADIGRPITDFTTRLRGSQLEADARKVLKDLAPIEREVETEQGHWLLKRLRPYRTLDDRIDGIVVSFVDITDRRTSERRLQALSEELDHRVKNVLARVLAMVHLARGDKISPAEALTALENRIRSMSRTHALLSKAQWDSVGLEVICEAELAPYRTQANCSISGADIKLNPEAAQTFTMVVHELATNAAKHGALSSPNGKVEMRIGNGEGELSLSWQESGGPAVAAPQHKSYGLSIIQNAIAREFNGNVDVTFHADGLRCEITAPLEKVSA